MTVCKFFQQGYCRYGQNCRFEHIYGSKYSYHVNPAPQPKPSSFAAPMLMPDTSGVLDDQLVNQVQSDVQAVLRGGQWILSCYSPFKEKLNFPGILDLSPEEARLFIYEAKANNTIDQAVAYMNNLLQETQQKYEKLLQPDYSIIKVIKSLYRGEMVPSPFSNFTPNTISNNSNSASSLFRSAMQNHIPFSQTTAQSVFSQNSIFSPSAPNPAKELFSQANTGNVFNTNTTSSFAQNSSASSPFAQNNSASSPFAQNNSAPGLFAQNNSAPSPFAQNTAQSIFASAVQNNISNPSQSTPASLFASANQNVSESTPFEMNALQRPGNQTKDDLGVYSKMDDLAAEDLEAFKASSFQLGFVPEIPPPSSLCSVQVKSVF